MSAGDCQGRVPAPVKVIEGPIRVLLIGCGPHGRTFYVPALKRRGASHGVEIAGIVELESRRVQTEAFCESKAVRCRHVWVRPFDGTSLPGRVAGTLDRLVDEEGVNAVIVCTDPTSHRPYADWALGRSLHLLLDKPVSSRKSAVSSLEAAHGILDDYLHLRDRYREAAERHGVVCELCVHRRHHPAIDRVIEIIREVCGKTGCPVTHSSSYHCDGQWRLPGEVLTQSHHSYYDGHGKISHSGFHFFDCMVRFWDASAASGKCPSDAMVCSSFVMPQGGLWQLGQADYRRLFGERYREFCPGPDADVAKRMEHFGEVDADIAVRFELGGLTVGTARLSLLHNGFSRRSWLEPGADLYKGNGRVKHEEHLVHVGPFLCVRVLSWQSKDRHATCGPDDLLPGGNNHFDVHVFRNADMIGGEPYAMFRLGEFVACQPFDPARLLIDQIKERCVLEFLDAIRGRAPRSELRSDLCSHEMSARLMSAVYQSHIFGARAGNPFVRIPVVAPANPWA